MSLLLNMLSTLVAYSSISHEVMGPDAVIFVFWMLSFKPTFSLSSFTFIKTLFPLDIMASMEKVGFWCILHQIFEINFWAYILINNLRYLYIWYHDIPKFLKSLKLSSEPLVKCHVSIDRFIDTDLSVYPCISCFYNFFFNIN